VNVTKSLVTPNGSIISYAWDFGDGSTGTGQKVAHFYTPGSYLVTLTVTDTAGLRSSETQHITISNPGVDLEASVDCNIAYPYVEYIQTCKVVTLDRLGQLSRIRITWGDGGVSNLALNSTQGVNKPTHTYINPSNYPVMVAAFTTRGETKNVATNLNLGHYNLNFIPIALLGCTLVL
jgi:PKD repeat protein